MAMSKKDYVAIAAAVKSTVMSVGPDEEPAAQLFRNGAKKTALAIADVMAQGNPRFDRDRFLKACGVIA